MNVTLFQASAENSDPTCAIASAVSVETSTPPPTSCKVPRPELFQKFAPKFAANACAFRPRKTPNRTKPSSAETFAVVKMFWMIAPVFTPKILVIESAITTRIATKFWVFSPTSIPPSIMGPMANFGTFQMWTIQLVEEMAGQKIPRNLPNATPTAAMVPV